MELPEPVKAVGGAVVGFAAVVTSPIWGIPYLIVEGRKHTKEMEERRKTEERRKAIPPCFDDGITKDEFEAMVRSVVEKLPRIRTLEIDGLVVKIRVNSNSGLSVWSATVDFNDFGHLTGWYQINSNNDQSPIPRALARGVKERIDSTKGEAD